MSALPGLVPPLLLGLFAAWCGSFAGGATFSGSAGGAAALLAAVAAAGPGWRDPLRLGRGRLLPLGLWAVAAASAWCSPVERAGRVGVVLLPAFLWLPAVVERCWGERRRLRWGLRATSAVVAAVSSWALLDWAGGFGSRIERAAMPLGHHTLLAAWLAMLLPLAVVAAREAPPWRWLGIATGLLAAAALLASRSAAGLLALAAELVLAWVWRREIAGESLSGRRLESRPESEGVAGEALAGRRLGSRPERKAVADEIPSRQQLASEPWRREIPRGTWIAGGLALAAAGALLVHRAGQSLAGGDLSLHVRGSYWVAGWRGFLARPALGWGPGSVAWTASRFLPPVPAALPGANPVGEAVGELHALPPEIAYELGLGGLLVAAALVAAFVRGRCGELRAAPDRPVLAASLLALAGGAVAGLGTGALRITALPLAAAVVAGAGLAAASVSAGARGAGSVGEDLDAGSDGANAGVETRNPASVANGGASGKSNPACVASGGASKVAGASTARRFAGWAVPSRVYALLAAILLAAPEAALWHYDRAVAAALAEGVAGARGGGGEAGVGGGQAGGRRVGGDPFRGEPVRAELARAVELDPHFPLYRWRLALLAAAAGTPGAPADAPGEVPAAARLAREAAIDGGAVAPLWLTAGVLGRQARLPWAGPALAESCRLDPLDPFPPFYLLAAEPDSPEAPVRGALALLDDPRLAAATFWEGRERLLASCLEVVRGWTGVDPGWKESLLAAVPAALGPRQGAPLRLTLAWDTSPPLALSLHTFRRRPWPGSWPLVAVRPEPLARLTMPPAAALGYVFLGAPPRPVCGLGPRLPLGR
jgi:hypothetical protein